jgi:hypothetical protein
MADKETRTETKEEGNRVPGPDQDDVRIPSAGGSLPDATVHRDIRSPLTKA